MRRIFLPLLFAACLCSEAAVTAAAEGPLHVPSPDWRDQVIYFVLTDRFSDGDPSNNDQGAGEYDPADPRRYSGGDLRGLRQRLDYVQALGATTVWITPPVAHQWWDGAVGYGGYHGYWAEHFMQVDRHYGDLDEYRALSRALHARNMYLVQDVVVNHTGNFFTIDEDAAGDPADSWAANPDSRPVPRPRQAPFSRNDARDPAQRREGIYHWTPVIRDYTDSRQEQSFQLADLDDLNTENPVVRRALRESYGYWIREVGVDGFRIDTAFYVTPDYFRDFLHSDDIQAPGMLAVAASTGRSDFHLFGEGFGVDRPYEETQARKIDAYQRGPGALPAMINFPLYGSLGDVFARGRPSAELGHRIASTMRVFADPHRMPTFVDNHDVDRFLASGNEAGLRQALLALMTLPGIPTIYYGTEQGFTGRRDAMFAGGFGSRGRDHFDVSSPLFGFLQRVIALRREHRLFSRGVPVVIAENPAGPGALAWTMTHEAVSTLVAVNSADHDSLLEIDGGLPPDAVLEPMFAIQGKAPRARVGADGRLTLRLPPRAGWVWRVATADTVASRAATTLTIERLPGGTGELRLQGTAPGLDSIELVRDGKLPGALTVPVRDGRWRARIDVRSLVDPAIAHRLVAWSPATLARSAPLGFQVTPEWRLLADVADAADDDHGPGGRYRYPEDPGWTTPRPLDLRRVQVHAAGQSLRVTVQMRSISQAWNPANGFDRVAFTLFLALPGRDDGVAAMPQQNDVLPGGLRWHYRLRAHGWSNLLTSAEGADATHEGRIVGPAASIAVDVADRTVSFTLPASALGDPDTLDGARLYVTTWDYDGGFRELREEPGAMHFSGGDGRVDPRWMDASAVVTLREPDAR